jgi:hypothetical protein
MPRGLPERFESSMTSQTLASARASSCASICCAERVVPNTSVRQADLPVGRTNGARVGDSEGFPPPFSDCYETHDVLVAQQVEFSSRHGLTILRKRFAPLTNNFSVVAVQ